MQSKAQELFDMVKEAKDYDETITPIIKQIVSLSCKEQKVKCANQYKDKVLDGNYSPHDEQSILNTELFELV